MNPVAAVIIAAGSSSRLGQPKQLVVFNGETLLQRSIRIARQAGATPVFVVLGAHREQIDSAVDFSDASVVVNERWEEGMASSIRIAIKSLQEQAPFAMGVLLMICDQPAVTLEHLQHMLTAFGKDNSVAIASVYAGKRGIPAIFSRDAFADLLALRGDRGARGLLSDPNRKVIEVALENGDLDIDLPSDLARLRSQ